MKEFVLIFRLKDISDFRPSPEQKQERSSWLAGIAAQGKLVDKGNSLLPSAESAKTIMPDHVILDGPHKDAKEIISGYIVVRTGTIDEAVTIARQNPVFKLGGSVEVREALNVINLE